MTEVTPQEFLESYPKNPIPYNEDKLIYKPIFSKDQLDYLEALNKYSNSNALLSPRNIEMFSIEFAYTSALLEGNTYSPVEAELLLTKDKIGGQKNLKETLMLKNMHESFDYLVQEVAETKKDAVEGSLNTRPFTYLVKNAHAIASKNLLEEEEMGSVRNSVIFIGFCSYVPSSIPQQLEIGLETIAKEYEKIENPFEKAVYAHQNLSYLQYFIDHNKRTARNMCAYTLMAADKMPVMFTERSVEEYAKAMTHYYESEPADYSKFAEYFIASYERVCSRMNAYAVEQAREDTGYLPSIPSQEQIKVEAYERLILELNKYNPEQAQQTLTKLKELLPDIVSGKIELPNIPTVSKNPEVDIPTSQDLNKEINTDKGLQ
ncbi:Fic/DOC family [Moraxella lacunata]|uniref:Fic/DOC family n=1 Tax=Moraxella lacunata TaxID=477 RepID=A0A378UC60_MORLA|nr:Fic family protein [Moraxella lacunata]STZ74907.1 Fic/DOC family [Moraxella lacunata]